MAPQMHMFSIGIQLKIIMAFLVLIAATAMLPPIAEYIIGEMRNLLAAFVQAMI
jgi:flagellar biosynthetic protein FliR